MKDGKDHSAMQAALEVRGVKWPLGGFAPGYYVQTCRSCGERHMADKRAALCLPCAVVSAAVYGETERKAERERGRLIGRRELAAEISRMAVNPSDAPPEYDAEAVRIASDGIPVRVYPPAEMVPDDEESRG